MSEYAGSNWIESSLLLHKPDAKMSELGKSVADLLGELFFGIYHLNIKALLRVDWENPFFIEYSLGCHELATTDFDELTRLVFLAHHFAIRVSIDASTHRYLKLTFHQRGRSGGISNRHPTLTEAVERFQSHMSCTNVPEFKDVVEA